MERKWGIGRLRLLVGDDLRRRFDSQAQKFNRAVHAYDPEAVEAAGPAMVRGWRALDEAATQAGAQPVSPEVWETVTDDGEVIAICRSNAEAAAVTRENRAMRVYTVDEVGRLLSGLDLLHAAKEVFPGATVTAARVGAHLDQWTGDDLPEALQ